jgi:hypothetical protein
MKAIPPLFSKAMGYLTEASDAYLTNDYEASLRIMDRLSWKVARLNSRIEMEINRKHGGLKNRLTIADIQALQNFNDQLAILEKKIIKEVKALKESGRRRLDSTDEDFLTCFRVEIEIDYFIGEDDPAYNDERDNCIATSKRVREDIIDYDDSDWNDMRHTELPLAHQKHCWLFHDLYDHANLSWKDILRIRGVYTHIIVYHGNDVTIQKELLYER